MDQDLREYRRKQVLDAIAARYAPKRPARAPLDVAVKPFGPSRTASSKPLFDVDGEGEEEEEKEIIPTANDEALALALQQEELGEDETEADGDLAKALALSRREAERRSRSESEGFRVGDVGEDELTEEEEEGDMEEVELVPSGTVTPAQIEAEEEDSEDEDEFEEVDTTSTTLSSARVSRGASIAQEMETPGTATNHLNSTSMIHPITVDDDDAEGDQVLSTFTEKRDSVYRSTAVSDLPEKAAQSSREPTAPPTITSRSQISSSSTVVPVRPKLLQRLNSAVNVPSPLRHVAQPTKSSPISVVDEDDAPVPVGAPAPSLTLEATEPAEIRGAPSPNSSPPPPPPQSSSSLPVLYGSLERPHSPAMYNKMDDEDDGEEEEEEGEGEEEEDGSEADVNDETRSTYSWSRSPTPPPRPLRMTETETEFDNVSPTSASPFPSHSPALKVPRDEDEDDGNLARADMVAESDDYARFVASIKHRDLNEVRGEIDDEIRVLNAENRVAMRDSDEITSSMIAQIQASFFFFSFRFLLFFFFMSSSELTGAEITDTFETFRYPIHNRTDGSRSAMCQTGPTRPRRRYHHRRFRRIPLWRYPVL